MAASDDLDTVFKSGGGGKKKKNGLEWAQERRKGEEMETSVMDHSLRIWS